VLGVVLVVVLGVVLVVVLGVGDTVAVGVAASATTCEGPNMGRARVIEAARATDTAGYATAPRRRMRRTGPLLMSFTENFLGCWLSGKRLRVVR